LNLQAFNVSVNGHPLLYFEPLKFMNFCNNANPDPLPKLMQLRIRNPAQEALTGTLQQYETVKLNNTAGIRLNSAIPERRKFFVLNADPLQIHSWTCNLTISPRRL
jgi:hypothetical protein